MISEETLRDLVKALNEDEKCMLCSLLEEGRKKEKLFAEDTCRFSHARAVPGWPDGKSYGLSKQGRKLLKELERASQKPETAHGICEKQLRYLKQLSRMQLKIPESYGQASDPRRLFERLDRFCKEHDIPQEIAEQMIPSLIEYMETGHMQPVVFLGEKGCGKTTTAKLLARELLQLPVEVIKVPQTDGGRGLAGNNGSYMAADVGYLARARLQYNSFLVAYVFDEIDKTPRSIYRAGLDEELLSVTDESCNDIFDNYLETTLECLEYCPIFFTANDLNAINPALADRCRVIRFPNADADRIKSILHKFMNHKLSGTLYRMVDLDFSLLDRQVDFLQRKGISSLRKYQQMAESAVDQAMHMALRQQTDGTVAVSQELLDHAAAEILTTEMHQIGFAG